MKTLNIIKRLTATLLICATALVCATSCSKDDDTAAPVNEGVIFQFGMLTVYSQIVSDMTDIHSAIITVSKGDEVITLPSVSLTGTAKTVTSEPVALAAGDYTVLSYTAYGVDAAPLFKAEIDEDNTFTVSAQGIVTFVIPVTIRVVDSEFSTNYIKNALINLCRECFGDDESKWPWVADDYLSDWPYLEFEYDDYGYVSAIVGINFDGKKFAGWQNVTELPLGTISTIVTLDTLTFSDMPALKSVPADLYKLPYLTNLFIKDTGVETFPANVERYPYLRSLSIINSHITSVPDALGSASRLTGLVLSGNDLTEFNAPLGELDLFDVDLSYNPITAIGEGVFSTKMENLHRIDLAGTKITTIPTVIKSMPYMKGLDLADCLFTAIPSEVKANTHLMTLYMDNNRLTSVSAADFAGMTALRSLSLAGNKITSLPKLSNAALEWINLSSCGLTTMPDFSALPSLAELSLESNDFTQIASLDFSANPLLAKISFGGCKSLTSLPSTAWGLPTKEHNGKTVMAAFSHVDVRNCPRLTWTTAAAWRAHEFTGKEFSEWDFGSTSSYNGGISLLREDDTPGDPYDESDGNNYYGTVSVRLRGLASTDEVNTTGVTFGK